MKGRVEPCSEPRNVLAVVRAGFDAVECRKDTKKTVLVRRQERGRAVVCICSQTVELG